MDVFTPLPLFGYINYINRFDTIFAAFEYRKRAADERQKMEVHSPALQIQSTYPFNSLSNCCCRRNLRNSCRFSTRSRSLANSLQYKTFQDQLLQLILSGVKLNDVKSYTLIDYLYDTQLSNL